MRCRTAVIFLSTLVLNVAAYGFCATYNSKAYQACMDKCIRSGTPLNINCSDHCQKFR